MRVKASPSITTSKRLAPRSNTFDYWDPFQRILHHRTGNPALQTYTIRWTRFRFQMRTCRKIRSRKSMQQLVPENTARQFKPRSCPVLGNYPHFIQGPDWTQHWGGNRVPGSWNEVLGRRQKAKSFGQTTVC
jgi:hypothetical protein